MVPRLLSYRVFSEKVLVGMVYDELVRRTIASDGTKMRVYLDRVCIKPGRPWREQFVEGLTHSLVFVPFVSRGALLNMASMAPGFDPRAAVAHPRLRSDEFGFERRLDPERSADNVCLEWQLALGLFGTSGARYGFACQKVLPVTVGFRRMAAREEGEEQRAAPDGGEGAKEVVVGFDPLSRQLQYAHGVAVVPRCGERRPPPRLPGWRRRRRRR